MSLALALDRSSPRPLRDQLAAQLHAAIASERLAPGVVLPATRALALHLGVSRGVVVDAYADLRQQGLVVGRARSLPRVAEARVSAVPSVSVIPPVPRLDLSASGADPALFPRRAWGVALQSALQEVPDRLLGETAAAGREPLRQALAEHLARSRGATASAVCVVVCQGATQAIDVACRLLAESGARAVAVEDPCAAHVREAVRAAGLESVPIPVDADGIVVERIGGVDAVIVAPAHQFPTGAVLSPARRTALLASGLTVIEDDRGAEHRYDGSPPAALQGSAPDRVLLAGSLSQSLAAGLRLGWLLVPAALVERATRLRARLDGGSPVLEQLALARLIETAGLDRHVRLTRAEYGRRRTALLAAIADLLPEVEVHGSLAGLHVALHLPAPVDRSLLAARALADRVRIETTDEHRASPERTSEALVVGYARIAPVSAPFAVRAIRRLIDPYEMARAPRNRARRIPAPGAPIPAEAMPGDVAVELSVLALDAYGAADVAAIASVVRACRADLVGLQNASGGTERIAAALGWRYWDSAHHLVSRLPLLRPAGRLHVLVEAAPGRYVAHANVYLSGDLYGPQQVIAGASPGRVAEIESRIRVPGIAPVLSELRALVSQGVPAQISGGFNAPAGRGWPVADALVAAGFADAADDAMGDTWPVPGFPADASEGSDRIDGIVVAGPVDVLACELVGEPGGPGVSIACVPWPSDHRAVVARLRVVPARIAPFAAPQRAVVAAGEPVRVVLAGQAEPGGRVVLVAAGGDLGRPVRRRAVVDAGPDGIVSLPSSGLRAGAYDVVRLAEDGRERSRSAVWISAGAAPVLSTGRRRYREGEGIELSWRDAPGNRWDWVGIYPEEADPSREEPLFYRFCNARPSGSITLAEHVPPGAYVAALMLDDGYEVLALATLEVRARAEQQPVQS